MNHPKYPLFTDDPHLYLFISEGPRGRITKAVIYSQIGGNLFNLGFGDWNEELRKLDDSSRSNNDSSSNSSGSVRSDFHSISYPCCKNH